MKEYKEIRFVQIAVSTHVNPLNEEEPSLWLYGLTKDGRVYGYNDVFGEWDAYSMKESE